MKRINSLKMWIAYFHKIQPLAPLSYIRSGMLLGCFAMFTHISLAYLVEADQNKKTSNGEAKSAGCSPALRRFVMDYNDVSALLEMGGVLFEDRQNNVAAYEVPKGGGVRAIFAASLWMGGKDVNGQLKLAAVRFRQVGNDFWGGPLTVNMQSPGINYDPMLPVGDNTVRGYGPAEIGPEVCAAYDKFFPISKSVVIRFRSWWKSCIDPNAVPGACDAIDEESLPTNTEMATLRDWPAHGDITKDQDFYLAPFYDSNNDGFYNPDDGDYPWYDDIIDGDNVECGIDRRVTLFGDETVWFVFNDKGNAHTETQGEPIGMEIRAQAFVFATSDEINRMTFYNYELINRSSQTLTETYFSQFVDPDLGNPDDDFVGCDVSRGLGYVYNGDNDDETALGRPGYGSNPPSVGVDFFEGPYQDPDSLDNPYAIYFDSTTQTVDTMSIQDVLSQKGIMYKGIGTGYGDGIIDNERLGMRNFTYFVNGITGHRADPSNATNYYNFMSGHWGNGMPFTYGGVGDTQGNPQTNYVFPGDSDPYNWAIEGNEPPFADAWTEDQAGNAPADRRFVQSAGPFTLKPGATNNITVGIVYGRAASGNATASIDVMKIADTKAQALFDACFNILDPPAAPRLSIQELENELILMLDNPSSSNNVNESYRQIDNISIPDDYTDEEKTYAFEGYQIYQLVDESASVSDIGDVSKARQVAQCDIQNDITTLYNYSLNEAWNILEGRQMVAGANNGIQHTFRITTDAFGIGSASLVNHKTYYFVAIAYAHNEYKQYDQNDPTKLDGQKTPYISSRFSYDASPIRSVSAVPHSPMPESGGTYQMIEYGTTPRVTRIDGYGNGNRPLEITAASREQIVKNGKLDLLEYEYGGAPINVKVIDPLNVADGYFELEFIDYTPTNTGGSQYSADTASWVIRRYTAKGGTVIDSVTSDRKLGVVRNSVYKQEINEQIIPQWGISVQISQHKYTLPLNATDVIPNKVTDPISATMTFADTSKQWLTFIEDIDAGLPYNWIRSGKETKSEAPNPGLYPIPWFDPGNYPTIGDPQQVYQRLLNGGVAPHYLTGNNIEYMPMAYHPKVVSATETNRKYASLSYLPSVDIIITNDRSKWTRVPVIEMGRNALLTEGGAQAGQLRKSPSRDKDGKADITGGYGMSWFPGYAIDLETGMRLNMAFGENSALTEDGGRDMIWNPSSRTQSSNGIDYIMGGVQPIWVFTSNVRTINGFSNSFGGDLSHYDPAQELAPEIEFLFRNMDESPSVQNSARILYSSLSWIAYTRLAQGQKLNSTDVTIRLRVNKEYKNYVATGDNSGVPKYSWSMSDISTRKNQREALSSVLDMINIVPNPYLAYSEYERNRLDTRIKITNLPDQCNIRIYSSNGKLIRSFKKDSPVTSIDWDLNNHQRVPVASGVYLIHVDVPGVGDRVLKAFIGVRQVDLQGI